MANAPSLYDRIGGEKTIKDVVQRMYLKMHKDSRILELFSGKTMASIKIHNLLLLRGLFSAEASNTWDADTIVRYHRNIFEEKNLNEKDFDLFVTYFVDSLIDEGIQEEVAHEIFLIIVKLRPIFAQGVKHQTKHHSSSADSFTTAMTSVSMESNLEGDAADAYQNYVVPSPEDDDEEDDDSVDQDSLLERIGGVTVLDAALQDFLSRLLADDMFANFFAHVSNPFRIAKHHFRFMVSALSETEDIDHMKGFVLQTHTPLFRIGLNEEHFYRCHEYFLNSFRCQGVPEALVGELDKCIVRFAPTFALGASQAKLIRGGSGQQRTMGEKKAQPKAKSQKGMVARLLRRARRQIASGPVDEGQC